MKLIRKLEQRDNDKLVSFLYFIFKGIVMKKTVAVLMGGISSERNISLQSGKACARALSDLGYEAIEIDVDQNLMNVLQERKYDVAFNALHGRYGEDGCIQGILEFLKIPYTHSGVLASALSMNKQKAKEIVSQKSVPVADSLVVNRFNLIEKNLIEPPYVIKPLNEGSSFGVFLVTKESPIPLDILKSQNWKHGNDVMLESYVAGRELTCVIMEEKALSVCEIEISKSSIFYNFEAKYQKGNSKHICPADIDPLIYKDIQRYSLLAHQALSCKGVTRSDFRFDPIKNQLIWLELNNQPGMTEMSLVPDVAKYDGISFQELVRYIVEDASCDR